ncbi:MAG TPA: VWA domain-containing protein [Candidatus Limnocylindrales bacterium]|nr:VWA domain-containing protein [Candidatus Limnocylindrales bacterium]
MPLITPLAVLGLLFVPAVIAMYLLRLRREETAVPSTLLWQRLVADVEANAPWQRLRRSLLLLLQLLLVVILVLLAARPFTERPAGLARDIVLVVDTSASMASTDLQPNRLTAAKQAAIEALRDLPTGGKVSVIEAGRTARIVAAGSSDLGRIRLAIESIQPTASTGDLADALVLASELAAQSGDAQVLVATDAALASVPDVSVNAPVRVLRVGSETGSRNQAIVALAVRTSPSGVGRSVFASVANLDTAPAQRRLELWGDGQLLESRDIDVDAQQRADVIIDDVDSGVEVVEVRLVARDPAAAASGAPPDQLAADDRAWAIVPPDREREILLVGDGDPFLETALSYLPNTRLFGVKPERYPVDAQRTDGTDWDLIIFEDFVPTGVPDVPTLLVAPSKSSPLGDVTGTLKDPGIGALSNDEPILRYVDLTTTHISEAVRLELPEWARSVIPGPRGAPLLYAGVRANVPTAVLAFEPRHSDLPLQVAFPILIANLTGELLGGSASPADTVKPGDPVALPLAAGAVGVRVARPDGSTVDLAPGTAGAGSVTFTQTEQLGVYTATPLFADGAEPSGPASPTASSRPTARPSGSPATGGGPVAGHDPTAPVLFAVDLFDVGESTIAPGKASDLEKLGRQVAAEPSPGASLAPGASPAPAGAKDRPPARDELWLPIALIVLIGLCVEWALYHRDVVTRGWRNVTRRTA